MSLAALAGADHRGRARVKRRSPNATRGVRSGQISEILAHRRKWTSAPGSVRALPELPALARELGDRG